MSFSYDPADDVGKVRLLIADRVEASALFSDEEIETFLELEGGVKCAAALAKETTATNQVLLLKVVSHLDLTTDGAAVARELRLQAAELRQQAEDEADADAEDVDVIEMELGPFSVREQILNEGMRG